MTKTEEIFKYMLGNDYIDSLTAFNKFGATRLSAVIYKLKDYGVEISRRMVSSNDRFNNPVTYARYSVADKDGASEIYRKRYSKKKKQEESA